MKVGKFVIVDATAMVICRRETDEEGITVEERQKGKESQWKRQKGKESQWKRQKGKESQWKRDRRGRSYSGRETGGEGITVEEYRAHGNGSQPPNYTRYPFTAGWT